MIWAVALVGGLGAAARFLVDHVVQKSNRLASPRGTLVVNVSACLLIGLLTGWSSGHAAAVVAVAGTGFLGGYSTFSTASVEAARLVLNGRPLAGARHAFGMLLLCLAAGWIGILSAQAITS